MLLLLLKHFDTRFFEKFQNKLNCANTVGNITKAYFVYYVIVKSTFGQNSNSNQYCNQKRFIEVLTESEYFVTRLSTIWTFYKLDKQNLLVLKISSNSIKPNSP